jgi:hypothetical protein
MGVASRPHRSFGEEDAQGSCGTSLMTVKGRVLVGYEQLCGHDNVRFALGGLDRSGSQPKSEVHGEDGGFGY